MERYGASRRERETQEDNDCREQLRILVDANDRALAAYRERGGPDLRSGRFDDEDADVDSRDAPTRRGPPNSTDAARGGGSRRFESEFEAPVARQGRREPGLGRGAGSRRRRPEGRFANDEGFEDETDHGDPRPTFDQHGRRGRVTAASSAGQRGQAHAGGGDDDSEDEGYGSRQGHEGSSRGGMRDPRRRGHGSQPEDDFDHEEMRGGRRAPAGFGGSSRRDFR